MAKQCQAMAAVCLLVCLSVVFINGVEGGRCKYIPHCDECTYNPDTKRATCTKCDPSDLYGLTTVNGFSMCRACSENSGCLKCKTFELCTLCRFPGRDGPDFDGVATCSACSANCRSCKSIGGGKCDICGVGSRKVGENCQACTVSQCKFCESDATVCTGCLSGSYLVNNECKPCVDNCRMCHNSDKCDYCANYYFLESDTGLCKPCMDNCRICADFGECTSCKDGFYVDNQKQCQPCDDSCTTCKSKDECYSCKQGRPANGSCKCAANCESCATLGRGKCDKCLPGFVQNKEKACKRACPENCESCTNQNSCDVCMSGFLKTLAGTCVSLN